MQSRPLSMFKAVDAMPSMGTKYFSVTISAFVSCAVIENLHVDRGGGSACSLRRLQGIIVFPDPPFFHSSLRCILQSRDTVVESGFSLPRELRCFPVFLLGR